MSKFGVCVSKLVQPERTTYGDLGADPPAAGGSGDLKASPPAAGRLFVIFLGKIAFLMPLDYISHVFRAIRKN